MNECIVHLAFIIQLLLPQLPANVAFQPAGPVTPSPRSVAETYQKDNDWPPLPRLPQLPHLFALLERFLADDRNWNPCLCSDPEVDAIERKLNAIAVHLQCEKQYAGECWKVAPRHSQSSVVHFFLLLKGMILAIVPDSCQTLMEANSTEKLVTEIFKLEVNPPPRRASSTTSSPSSNPSTSSWSAPFSRRRRY